MTQGETRYGWSTSDTLIYLSSCFLVWTHRWRDGAWNHSCGSRGNNGSCWPFMFKGHCLLVINRSFVIMPFLIYGKKKRVNPIVWKQFVLTKPCAHVDHQSLKGVTRDPFFFHGRLRWKQWHVLSLYGHGSPFCAEALIHIRFLLSSDISFFRFHFNI